jgi:hypothetical protein
MNAVEDPEKEYGGGMTVFGGRVEMCKARDEAGLVVAGTMRSSRGSNQFDCGERWILFCSGLLSPCYVVCRVVSCSVVLCYGS